MSSVLKRLLGLVILLVGLSGVGISIAGWRLLPGMVERIHANLEATLLQTSAGLDTVQESLLLAKSTISDLETTLTTVETNMMDLGDAVGETRPFLDQVSVVAADELPETLETIETAIPDMAQVAGIVDDTLTTLNKFRIDETFLGLRINYSLGVDYNPDVPFDETVLALGESLDGLPESLRGLQTYADETNENLAEISDGLYEIAADMETLNGRLSEINPLLNDYLQLITETNDATRQIRAQMSSELDRVHTAIKIAMIWLALSQLAPIYLGLELLAGKRNS